MEKAARYGLVGVWRDLAARRWLIRESLPLSHEVIYPKMAFWRRNLPKMAVGDGKKIFSMWQLDVKIV